MAEPPSDPGNTADNGDEFDIPKTIKDTDLRSPAIGNFPAATICETAPGFAVLIQCCEAGNSLPQGEEPDVPEAQNLFLSHVGGIIRKFRGVEPWLYLRNTSSGDITMWISPKRPRRILTSANANASAAGGAGGGISSSLYIEHTTHNHLNCGELDVVQVTHYHKYVFVDVYLGTETSHLPVKGGMVPLGGLAWFNGSRLRVFDRRGRELRPAPFPIVM